MRSVSVIAVINGAFCRYKVLAAAGLVAALFLAFGAAPGLATSYDLDKVMKGKVAGLQSEVRGAGGYYGDCIRVTLTNDTGQPVTVDVPLGLLLVPANRRVQTMVCAGGESLDAPPGTTVHLIKAFCGERHDDAPGTGDVFSPGGRATGDLMNRVKDINRGQRFDRSVQDRVWEVTNLLDLQKGAGTPSSTEKKATGAAVLTTLILLIWQLTNSVVNIPGVPVPVPEEAGGAPPPADDENGESGGNNEKETESYDDRPAWSLVHRKFDDDLFDDKNERWVRRSSPEGKAIIDAKRRAMEAKGYDYDAEHDAFVERGLVYDKDTDSFRKPLEKPEPAGIKPEEGDASKMYIGPGWLLTGDPGTSSDPEVVNKNLNERLKYLDALEDDVESEHEALNDRLKKVQEQKDKDPWLEEQLREQRDELKQKMRDVQEQKLDLTRRVNERDREYNTWDERQRKSWTAKKVAKELSEVFIPNAEGLKPLFERAIELRDKLQKAIKDQPGLFKDVDGTIDRIKRIAAELKSAQDRGDADAVRSLQGEMSAARAKLQGLTSEMQLIHKKSAQWQAGSHVLTATAAMTANQYIGQGRMIYEIGKSGAQFLKPTTGFKRPTLLEPTESGRAEREFYVVDREGNLRKITGADAPDYKPRKGELLVGRDPYSGKLTEQEFGGGGRGQPLTEGQKNLLRQQAEQGLAGKPLRSIDAGRRLAGSSAVASSEEGPATFTLDEEKPGAGSEGGRPGKDQSWRMEAREWSRRELMEKAKQEDLARMSEEKPGGAPPAGGSGSPPPRKDPDLRELVPKKPTFRDARAQQNYEKLMAGEEPDFSGAQDYPETAAGWSERDWMKRQAAIKAGQNVESQADRLEYWKERDPQFKEMDKMFGKAQSDAQHRMIDEIKPDVIEQMKKEGWTQGQPGFEDELGKRLGADLRIHSGKKVQEYYFDNLTEQKPDLTPSEEKWYHDKHYEYMNKPIPDQPEVPTAPPPRPKTSTGPVEQFAEGRGAASSSAPETPAGPPPGETVVPPGKAAAGPVETPPDSGGSSPAFGKTRVPPPAGRPASELGGMQTGKTAAGPVETLPESGTPGSVADAPGAEPAPEMRRVPAGKTMAAPPSAPPPDETPMASFEPSKSPVHPEAVPPRAATPAQATAAVHPQPAAPASHPAEAPRPAVSRTAKPNVGLPSESPSPISDTSGTARGMGAAGRGMDASPAAGEPSFGAEASPLESASSLKEAQVEAASGLEGAGRLERASSFEDLRSSLSSQDISEAGALETAELGKALPLQENRLSFSRMLQGFLRKPK